MIKKLFLSVIIGTFSTSAVWAYNAHYEHEKYRQQLNYSAGRQRVDNRKYINYYKGKPDACYSVSGIKNYSYTGKDKIYEKKGIKFKVDNEPQKVVKDEDSKSVIENKAQTAKEEKNATMPTSSKKINVVQSATSKTMTKTSEMQTKVTTETKSNHNADAE